MVKMMIKYNIYFWAPFFQMRKQIQNRVHIVFSTPISKGTLQQKYKNLKMAEVRFSSKLPKSSTQTSGRCQKPRNHLSRPQQICLLKNHLAKYIWDKEPRFS